MKRVPNPRSLKPHGGPRVYTRKLSEDQVRDAAQKHYQGVSLRTLASEYGCSHEWLRHEIKDFAGYIPSASARRFLETRLDDFVLMIEKGVSPEVAAGACGVSNETFQHLMNNSLDFSTLVTEARNKDISQSEMCVAEAAKGNWKAALERLQRLPETKEMWKKPEEEKQSSNIVNVTMSWDREGFKNTKTIEHEDD